MIQRQISIIIVLVVSVLVFSDTQTVSTPIYAQEQLCFPETGECVSDVFLAFWQQHGGQEVFGLSISSPAAAGDQHTMQWFEQARLELHSQNLAPYQVQLGRLGAELLQARGIDWRSTPRDAGPQPGCLWFAATRVNLCDQGNGLDFKSYWEQNGLPVAGLDQFQRSLARFGMPLTPLMLEANDRGEHVLVQWFERARLEQQVSGGQNNVRAAPLGSEFRSGAQDAWARARRLLPGTIIVLRPAFVPERFGPPLLQEAQLPAGERPRYTVTYAAQDEGLVFILNMGAGALGNFPPPETREQIVVRGTSGEVLTSKETNTMGISWQESGGSYQITASAKQMTKDELLQIANSLVAVAK